MSGEVLSIIAAGEREKTLPGGVSTDIFGSLYPGAIHESPWDAAWTMDRPS